MKKIIATVALALGLSTAAIGTASAGQIGTAGTGPASYSYTTPAGADSYSY